MEEIEIASSGKRPRPWLAALKALHDDAEPQDHSGEESAERLAPRTDKTAESSRRADEAPIAPSEISELGETTHPLADDDPAVLWRVAALRPHVARTGPIILPPVRAEGVPPLAVWDAATGAWVYGPHCGSCGELREEGQTYHCRACQRARYLVLLEIREDVPIVRQEESRGDAA